MSHTSLSSLRITASRSALPGHSIKKSPALSVGGTLLMALATAPSLLAGDAEWTGMGAGALWSAAGNWSPTPPAAADTAVFGSGFASGLFIFRFGSDPHPDALRINATTDFGLMGSTLGLGSGALTREAGASGLHSLLLPIDLNPNNGPAGSPALWNVQGSGQMSISQSVSTGGRVWQVNAGTFGQATAPLKLAASVDGRFEAAGEIEFQGLPSVASLYSTAGLNVPDGVTLSVTGPLPVTLAGGAVRGPGTLAIGTASLNETGTAFSGSPTLRMSPAANATSHLTGDGITGLGAFEIGGAGTVQLGADVSAAGFSPGAGGLDLNGSQFTVTGPAAGTATLTLPGTSRLSDSSSGGSLRLERGNLQNDGVSLVGQPSITMAPPAGLFTQITGQPLTGLGQLRIEGPGTVSMGTAVTAEHLEAASGGRMTTSFTPLQVMNGATLAAGSQIIGVDPGTGMFTLSGGSLLNNGATLLNQPSLVVDHGTSSATRIGGTAALTGLGDLVKSGAGTLTLDQDVGAKSLDLVAGTVDLNGHEFTTDLGSITLVAGSTLADSGSGGRLKIGIGGFSKENGATITGTPDVYLAPGGSSFGTLGGNFRNAAGGPEIGELTLTGGGLSTLSGSDIVAEHLTVKGRIELLHGQRLEVTNGITFDNGYVAYNFDSPGTIDAPIVKVKGGTINYVGYSYAVQEGFPYTVNLHVDNAAASPVIVSGPDLPHPNLIVGPIKKSGTGELRLESDLTCQPLTWDANGGKIDLNGHWLKINSTSLVLGSITSVGPGNVLSDSAGNGTLLLNGVSLRNAGGQIEGEPDLFINYGFSSLVQDQTATHAWQWGKVTVNNDTEGTTLGSLLARELHVSDRAVFSSRTEDLVTVKDLIHFGVDSFVRTSNLHIESGRIEDEGVTFFPHTSTSPLELSVINTVADPVTFAGPSSLHGLRRLRKVGPGLLKLEANVTPKAFALYDGTLDLNGHTIEVTHSISDISSTVMDSSSGSTGGFVMRGGDINLNEASVAGTPDVTMHSGPNTIDSPLLYEWENGSMGWGKLTCDTTDAPAGIHGILGVQKFHLAAGGTYLNAQIFAEQEIELAGGTSLIRPITAALPTALTLKGGRLINHGVTIGSGVPINILSTPADGSTIEGTEALITPSALSISGTGRTTLSVPVNSGSLLLSGGVVNVNGLSMISPNIALYDDVRVENTGGAQGALISGGAGGSPITLRSGWIGADMQPMNGLVKSGSDTFTLAGRISLFGGTFDIVSGTVVLEGNFVTGEIPITLRNGATLAGSGSHTSVITLENGSHLTPSTPGGAVTGQLILARPNIKSGAQLDFDLGTPVTGSDSIVLPTGLNRPTDGGKITINIRRTSGYSNLGVNYVLLDATGASGFGLNITDYQLGAGSPTRGTLAVVNHQLIFAPAVDADGDGMEDNWELAKFGNIATANPTTDTDGDGFLDIYEYAADTDPKDPNSLLKITAVSHIANGSLTILTFTSKPGQRYRLENSTDLQAWALIYDIDSAAAGFTTTTSGLASLGDGSRTFYRVTPLLPEL